MAAFEEFGVLPEIAKAVDELEWTFPTDIQAEAIPVILGGGDVLLAAETGSGKTAAFSLPLVQVVWETLKDIHSGKMAKLDTKAAAYQDDSPPWTMSRLNRGNAVAVAPDGLLVQSCSHKEWHGVRCTRGVTEGKWGFEATVKDDGLCRVGWSTLEGALDLGTDKNGWGYGGTGKKVFNRQFDGYGETYGLNDVITCLVDMDEGEVKFLKNGVDLGVAFTGVSTEKAVFPAVVMKDAEMEFNFGQKEFKYGLPEGYLPVVSAPEDKVAINLIDPTNSVSKIKLAKNAPQAIIVEPSRELAEQTTNQIKLFKKYLKEPNVRELLLTGGVDLKEQVSILQKTGADIVIGSPGRIESMIKNGHLSLSNCRFFVLDEADGLLKQNFGEFIEWLHEQMPKLTADGRRLQMIVCSATLHSAKVKQMSEKLMHFPKWIDLKGEDSVPEYVHHVFVKVDPAKDKSWLDLRRHIKTDGTHLDDKMADNDKPESLSEAIKILKGQYVLRAIEELNMEKCIIFCRTKLDCDNLEKYFNRLDKKKYSCVCLHGDRNHERRENLDKFKKNKAKFLICTDIAARGIDITGLPYIINMTLPNDPANYVHRIGRVGRAERMGLAISLLSTVPEKVWFHGDWCSTRGRNCSNREFTDAGGCCIWYNELQCLSDIEDHLVVTIQEIERDFKIPQNVFDGKVVYGQKLQQRKPTYQYHTDEMVPIIETLTSLEVKLQQIYLNRFKNNLTTDT